LWASKSGKQVGQFRLDILLLTFTLRIYSLTIGIAYVVILGQQFVKVSGILRKKYGVIVEEDGKLK
jgi:hypothetical protein